MFDFESNSGDTLSVMNELFEANKRDNGAQHNTGTFRIYGHTTLGQVHAVTVEATFDEQAPAEALAAQFPKSTKVECFNRKGSNSNLERVSYWAVGIHIVLKPTGVSGFKNETGMKRICQIMSKAPWAFIQRPYGSQSTIAELQALFSK